MVESDAFLQTAEQRMQQQAMYNAALMRAADVLRGPVDPYKSAFANRGTPAKAKTVRKFVRDRVRNAKLGLKEHVMDMRGFRPVLPYEPNMPDHIKAMLVGVP